MINKKFLKKMKETLLEQKREILDKAYNSENSNINDVDTDGDEIDGIQGNLLIELENQLLTRNAEKLIKIDAALDKINEETYGKCEDCEDPIAEKRLIFNPHFLICISCAEDRETEEKRKRL